MELIITEKIKDTHLKNTDPTLCLNMIVKNESKIITRMFDAVIDLIDCYCICDTGSTDNTIELIMTYFIEKGIPGKIIQEPFKNFAHNRNVALQACKGMSAYVLLLDADMILHLGSFTSAAINSPMTFVGSTDTNYHALEKHEAVKVSEKFVKNALKDDFYYIFQGNEAFYYQNIRIVRNNGLFTYVGVTHEHINVPPGSVGGIVFEKQAIFIHDIGDGGAKNDKFKRDISLLEQGLVDEPHNTRYVFYLGNSYRDNGDYDKAIETYKKQLLMPAWNQEKYCACLSIGNIYFKKGDKDNAAKFWLKTSEYDTERIEGIINAMDYYRQEGENVLVNCLYHKYKDYKRNLAEGKLFVEQPKYCDVLEYNNSIAAYYANDKESGYACCKQILLHGVMDKSSMLRTLDNLVYYKEVLLADTQEERAKLFTCVDKFLEQIDETNLKTQKKSENAIWRILSGHDANAIGPGSGTSEQAGTSEMDLVEVYQKIKTWRIQGKSQEALELYNTISSQHAKYKDYLWQLAYEYSVFAYYTGVRKINPQVVTILNNCEDAEIITSVMSNLKFYPDVLKADKTYDFTFSLQHKINDVEYKFNSSSSSLIPYKDGYLMNVRLVNYRIDPQGSYHDCDPHIITINKCVYLTNEFTIVREKLIDIDYTNRRYMGIEDVRIFDDGTGIQFIGTGYHNNNTIGIVYGLYAIDIDRLIPQEVKPAFNLNSGCEKNWVYVNYKNETHVVYCWFPLKICKIQNAILESVEEKPMPAIFKRVRGSSCGFKYGIGNGPNKYELWFVVHLVSYETPRNYYHMLVILDENMDLLRYTAPFKFEDVKIEYCLGVVVEAERVIMAYSTWDCSTKISIYNKKYIDDLTIYCYFQNPFLIDIADKEEYNIDEYTYIQEQLNNKNINSMLKSLYLPQNNFYTFEDFKYRCTMGFRQKIIDITSNKLPFKKIYKFGNDKNSKNCIVCCTPFLHTSTEFNKTIRENSRYIASQKIINSLEQVKYNGDFYLFNGGFPNPTGIEMKYVGVPYCFKIFMMLEAKKLGYEKIIWIDSGCYSINNPQRLFDILDEQETIIENIPDGNNYDAMVFSKTKDILNTLTNVNLNNAHYIRTIVFGLNIKSNIIMKIINEYYAMVKLGTPFLSIFPEEIVLTSILNKPEYKHLLYNQCETKKLHIHEKNMDVELAKKNGYYFYHTNYASKQKKYVSFDDKLNGRFGNQLFRYLTCKLLTILFDVEYVYINNLPKDNFPKDNFPKDNLPKDNFPKDNLPKDNFIIINEDNITDIIKDKHLYETNSFLIGDGYFQKSELFVNYREKLLELICNEKNNDYFFYNNECIYIKDYLINNYHSVDLKTTDIVIHIRLDDFIQYPCKTSNIIPPQYYIELLTNEHITDEKIYIVCDKLKYDWEFKYIEFFNKFNPILIQNNLKHDIALIRDCKKLLHSNSSLCWIISFLSKKIRRIIPYTSKEYMNQKECLKHITIDDVLKYVTPLDHDEVHKLNAQEVNIFPLSFSIPDECIFDSIHNKKYLLASLIPGNISTYIFNKKEKEYNEMYRNSRFAITKKKGGWDCLRHYEILMNGCIPLFENLQDCPTNTLTTYPKELNEEAYNLYNNWSDTEEYIQKYNILNAKFLEHTRKYCTTSSTAKYFLDNIKGSDKIKNILLITCHHGINYNRESLWIGLKRYIKSINGVAVEFNKLPFLYNDFDNSQSNIYYGENCFTYPNRLQKDNDYNMTEAEIIEKINNNFWDIIIYGKVGPDEFCSFPLYDIVKTKYNKNKIVFIFGGDEVFNLKINDKISYYINMFNRCIYYWPYSNYLNYYKQFGTCFVRELDI